MRERERERAGGRVLMHNKILPKNSGINVFFLILKNNISS
jgi:hypothetical protein